MPGRPVSVPERDPGALRGLPIDREGDALVLHVPQHQRLRRRRADAVLAGNGLGVEQPVDPRRLGVATPDSLNRGDQSADERSGEPVGGDLDHEDVSRPRRRRSQVPDGPGVVARQVVEVVAPREPVERVANAVVVHGVGVVPAPAARAVSPPR